MRFSTSDLLAHNCAAGKYLRNSQMPGSHTRK